MGEIEKKRKELKYTQEEIARKTGITRQYYNSIENNKKKPSVSLAKQLSEVMEVDWTIFFE
ncbi:helix-turn-helix transcriptional regulator [Halobacillus aidingensis]|uniref:Putative transcriptional regulator n=1 Tax=Halobacillus aidingensis TaxID=240303 RepID=A0A1H0MKP0_HALAD|nr:helix-turn-helix transcriptional regulator [Halobacillus aidingensis]SDO80710.1 putative transcriptional regulator [Halobacillus aidingensis]